MRVASAGIADHDGHDRVLARHEPEARRLHALAEVLRVVGQLRAQLHRPISIRSSTASVVAATTGAIEFENR